MIVNLLDPSLSADQVRAQAQAAPADAAGFLVHPTDVVAVARLESAPVIAVAGYPTGRHHSLIKASEARLAVQSGAAEVWVSIDATLTDPNVILPDLITVREACPEPVRLGVLLPALIEPARATIQAASLAGFNLAVASAQLPAEHLPGGLPIIDFPA